MLHSPIPTGVLVTPMLVSPIRSPVPLTIMRDSPALTASAHRVGPEPDRFRVQNFCIYRVRIWIFLSIGPEPVKYSTHNILRVRVWVSLAHISGL